MRPWGVATVVVICSVLCPLAIAQTASPGVNDPAKLRFGVRCTQVLNDAKGFGDPVLLWIGSTGKTLFEDLSNTRSPESWHGTLEPRMVIGVLANEIDLSQDEVTAKQVLASAARFAQSKCESKGAPSMNISIEVRHGDPATFTEDKFTGLRHKFDRAFQETVDVIYNSFQKSYPLVALEGATPSFNAFDEKEIPWTTSGGWGKASYRNRDKERVDEAAAAKARETLRVQQQLQQVAAEREQRARQAEAARVQQAQMAAQAAAVQKVRSDIAARSAAFVAAYGVKHFVTVNELAANPFVYQGQVVAVFAVFEQMNSATEALFSVSMSGFPEALLVSAVPSTKFTKTRSVVMLAGRVLGKREVKLPLVGATLVPHLSFVGSAFCQKQNCDDYSINVK